MDKNTLAVVVIAIALMLAYFLVYGNLSQTVGALFDAIRTGRIWPHFQFS